MWCRCALVGLAACVPVPLSAQAPPATVDTIVIVNRNVFDADGDAPRFLTRLVNAVHVTTRPWVIRHALLVNPGDRYDSARAVESERALRALYVFSRVRVDTTRLAGRLAVRAVTTDGWSTKPQFGFSSAAGDVSWMVGIAEDNFLGTATSLTAVHNHTPDRNIFDLHYQSPHFFGRCDLTARAATPFTPRAGTMCASGSAGCGAGRCTRPSRQPCSPTPCSAP